MQPGSNYSCVFVTTPNISVARKIAVVALSQKLVACANLIPRIESHYWWQGELQSSSEVLVIFKTTKAKLVELEQCVLKNHPYQTPECIAIGLDEGTEKYLAWLGETTGKPAWI